MVSREFILCTQSKSSPFKNVTKQNIFTLFSGHVMILLGLM